MSFIQIIYSIFVLPFVIILEYLFSVIQKGFDNKAIPIFFVMLVIDVISYILFYSFRKEYNKYKNKKLIIVLIVLLQLVSYISLYCFIAKILITTRMQLLCLLAFIISSGLSIYLGIKGAINQRVGKTVTISFFVFGIVNILFIPLSLKRTGSKSLFFLQVVVSAVCIATFLCKNNPNINEKVNGIFARIKHNHWVFIVSCIYMTVFLGVLIPSAVIKSSPQEFVDIYHYKTPLWFILSSACISFGLFFFWICILYVLATEKMKSVFTLINCVLCVVVTINYAIFGRNQVIISNSLKYTEEVRYNHQIIILNLFVILLVGTLTFVLVNKIVKKSPLAVIVPISVMIGINSFNSLSNCIFISKDMKIVKRIANDSSGQRPYFNLSKNGKNVIVFMVDRALGELVPYLVNEKPELAQMYDGFSYYPNTVSFGVCTNIGAPALFGGYEYTPDEMNKREEESLKSKHDEALKVMPALFYENGYKVTVCDAPYAGYQATPDLSIYDDYPGMNTFITDKYFWKEKGSGVSSRNFRNFFCYSIMKSSPLIIQNHLYNDGLYNDIISHNDLLDEYYEESTQIKKEWMVYEGYNSLFLSRYMTLVKLDEMTNIVDEDYNTFMMIDNLTPHVENAFLQEPDYEVSYYVDNREYEKENIDRYDLNGIRLNFKEDWQYGHYQGNMATLLQIGKWLDYLKEEEVYDNTRIIIVADHGMWMNLNEMYNIDDGKNKMLDIECYYPLLMIKDFDSHGFSVNEEFMTNADVPTYAMKGLIEDPINPFTGKKINNDEKYSHPQKIMAVCESDIYKNNGNKFIEGMWLSVEKDMRDKNNWKIISR